MWTDDLLRRVHRVRRHLRLARPVVAEPAPLQRIVRCGTAPDAPRLCIDLVVREGAVLLVAGWATAPLSLSLSLNLPMPGQAQSGPALAQDPFHALTLRRFDLERFDVAQHLSLPDARCGFALVAHAQDQTHTQAQAQTHPQGPADVAGPAAPATALPLTDRVTLHWHHPVDGSQGRFHLPVSTPSPESLARSSAAGSAILALARQLPPFSPLWQTVIGRCPDTLPRCSQASGHLEHALGSGLSGLGLATGWVLAEPGTPLWLQADDGPLLPLDPASRHFRHDAWATPGQAALNTRAEAGFTLSLQGVPPGTRLRLRALTRTGLLTLGQAVTAPMADSPIEATRQLLALDPDHPPQARHIEHLHGPLLQPLVEHRLRQLDALPVEVLQVGQPPEAPVASLIVPLFARRDFVEHQLLSLSDDAAFKRHVELIYVIDDPRLLDHWREDAEQLGRQYDVPMRWIWGGANRGYAGANNLGAAQARGRHLVFMNSDVFPRKPGWVERLSAVLDTEPGIGAVGPRLLFADGSIQHAGMSFRWRPELGIWVNHHLGMGLAPEFDPHRTLTRVDAVTGACLALRRRDFDAVGGWDAGYLIGDFEDSDLCLKLHHAGLDIAYVPQVELTHLQRQSMRSVGDPQLRGFVTTYNAVRHQQRWPRRLPVGADALAALGAARASHAGGATAAGPATARRQLA